MKITSFNPIVATAHCEEVVKLFEDLGFEKRHTIENIDNAGINAIDMKNEDGFRVDVGDVKQLPQDMMFIKELRPSMVGIGPFITHKDTPFYDKPSGTLELTLFMLGLIRLTLPYALIPSTTALGTIAPNGRELGLKAGANVIMPNLSPVEVRKKYMLYDNKICTGEESAQCVQCLKNRVSSTGYEIVTDRGDVVKINN